MPEYVCKRDSILLPMASKDEAAKVVRKDQTVELDAKVAQYFVERGALEEVSTTSKSTGTRGRKTDES